MLASTVPCMTPLSRGGARRCTRRRKRLMTVSATAKKDVKKPGNARLARILRQYDDAALAQQQQELEEYQQQRNTLRGGDEPGSSRKLRGSAGSAYISQADKDKRALVFRWDSNRNTEVAVRGGLGRGQVCWWALWIKVNREKQVAEALVRLAAELGPLRDLDSGEPTGEARLVETWAPVKKVKAWNPKTGKVGHKTLRYLDGGVVFLRCVLDEEMELLLQRNVNVLGFKDVEIMEGKGGKEEKFPKPCNEEEIRAAQEWELDLTPLDEAAVRKMLGLPDKDLAATYQAIDQEEEAEATREFNRREQIIRQRDWYDGSGRQDGAGAGPQQAQRGRQGQEGAGSREEDQAWQQWWEEGGGLASSAAGTAGRGALGAALDSWGAGGGAAGEDRGPPSEGQLKFLAELGHSGPAPESRTAASKLIDEMKAARRGEQSGAPDPQGPASEGQLRYLGQLGYQGEAPATRGEAAELIDSLKAQQAQQGAGGRGRDGKLDRSGPPSKGQLELLGMLNYSGDAPATRGEADRIIDEIKASRPRRRDSVDDRQPPSEGQLRYLGQLGYQGELPATRSEARELIDTIKSESAAKGLGSFATLPPNPDSPPSEGQRRYLTLLGYEGEAPATRGGADELIDRLKEEAQAAGTGGAFDPSRPASEGQLRYLTILGHEAEGDLTRGEADALIESLKKQRIEPPSQGQLRFLSQLGYRGRAPASRSQADEIINGLREQRGEAYGGPDAPPSEAQLGLLGALGFEGQAPATRAEASSLISELKTAQRAQRAQQRSGSYDNDGEWQQGGSYESSRGTGPPTEGQLRFLGQLGYEGPEPASWAEAGELITALKAQQKASGVYSGGGGDAGSAQPTDGQLRFLSQLNYDGPEPATRAEAGELIATLKAQKQAQVPDPNGPPSEGQLRYLGQLGYEGEPPATRAEVGALIDSLKTQQSEERWQQGRGSGRSSSSGGWFSGSSSDEDYDDALSYFGISDPATADPYAAGSGAAAGAAGGGGLWGSAPGLSSFEWAGASSSGDEREGGEELWGGWQEQATPQRQPPAVGSGAAWSASTPVRDGRSRRGEPLDPQAPPSDGQLRYLDILGHQGPPPATRGEADEIIDSLKAQGAGRERKPKPSRGERDSRGGRRDRERDWESGRSRSSGGWYTGGGGEGGGWDEAAGDTAAADLSWWDEPAASGPAEGAGSSSSTAPAAAGSAGEGPSSYPLWDLPSDEGEAGQGGSSSGRRAGRRESGGGRGSDKQAGEGAGEAAGGPAAGLGPGAAVEVVGGSFADFQGKVLAVEGQRITAELDIFGRPTRVELDPRDIKPL